MYGLKKAKNAGLVRKLRILCESPLVGQIESGLEGGVHRRRIGLATRLLHHLTDEPGGELRLGLHLFHLVGIGGDHRFDGGIDGAGVGHLLHAAALHHLTGITAFLPDDVEQVLGDFSGDSLVRLAEARVVNVCRMHQYLIE